MAKSLLEQLPEVVVCGRQHAKRTLEGEAIQMLSGMLVEDYDYSKTGQSKTRRQHRVKLRPRTYKAKACCVIESLRCGVIRW
ncbi:hypothetical protein B0E51_11850 [Rhodanobacter sp. C05]|nr:hypothetical protein B0E51_11850 [Rhodanobacter sp. C05]